MNNNDFPNLKWSVKEVLKEEIKTSSITSATILLFHEPEWVIHNPTIPPKLNINMVIIHPQPPEGPGAESIGLQIDYRQLIISIDEPLNTISHIAQSHAVTQPLDKHNWIWVNQNAKALCLTSNINFTQRGLMNWKSPTPWL